MISNCPIIRFYSRLACILAVSSAFCLPSQAQTSSYSKIAVAGSFNGWNTITPNMTLVADNLWQANLTITNTYFQFKFSTEGFAQNWGVNNQPHSDLPQSETGVTSANDINVTNGSQIVDYRFLFNDSTREYSVILVNNIGSNLLYNPSFEVPGSQQNRAKYWEFWNPNTHGGYSANAQRQGSNWNYIVKSGSWLGLIGASWAGSDNGSWWQEAPVEAGLTYEAAGWFNAEGAPNTWQTADQQELKLEFYNFDHSSLLASFSTDLSSVSNVWAEHAVLGVAPAGAAWARMVFYANGVKNSGTLRMDDASLKATIAKRTEDFNEWTGATVYDCYSRSGWKACQGRTVSSYTYGSEEIPLAVSGLAISLNNPTVSNTGSYVQSPRFLDGIGSVSFYYRHGYQGDPADTPEQPVHFKVQRSVLGDFWTTIAEVSNVVNTSYLRFDVFQYETLPNYIRIVHSGGSTNTLLIDNISVDVPNAQPRIMTFNTWSNATTAADYFHLGWQLKTGFVSSAFAIDGLAGQVSGNVNDGNFLRSPTFNNGHGPISFQYRLGASSPYTTGFSLESSTNGTVWTVLDTVTNISTIDWLPYNRFFIETTPRSIRIRNLAETNISPNNAATINQGFDQAPEPPAGWTFNSIGSYDSASSSGENPPSLKFAGTGASVSTPALINPTNLKFMAKGQSIDPGNTFLVEGNIDGAWQQITLLTNMTDSKITHNINLSTNTSQIRFTYTKNGIGNLAFDDVRITGFGFGLTPPPQNLVLENVNVGEAIEYRSQNFNTWPTKPSYDSGVDFYQGWTLEELVKVTTNKAKSGQAATLARATGGSSGSDYIVEFEGPGETKTSYASGDVTLNGLDWNLTEALIGTLETDYKTGDRSLRMRGRNGSVTEMIQDKNGGLGTISFQYRQYGTDGAQQPWAVEYSTNNGGSWTQIGSPFTAGASVETFEETVNVEGSVRVRIRLTTSPGTSGNRRANVDNIVMSGYDTGGGDSINSSITSHYLTDGIGTVTFDYRHILDSTPPAGSVMTAVIQTSSNGVNWVNAATQIIANTEYALFEGYINKSNHYYARITVTNGTSEAIIDNITVSRPHPPANVSINGYIEPLQPFTNDSVNIFANVTPLNGAREITVTSYYRVGTSGMFTAISMTPVGGNLYQTISAIPPQVGGTIVQYYISAWYKGPGSNLTRPATYPANAPTNVAFYGIPRNAPGKVWINEIDYWSTKLVGTFPNYTNTVFEFVELAGFEGVDIDGWSIELVSGNTTNLGVFGSYVITNMVFGNETNGFGFWVLAGPGINSPPSDMLMTNRLSLTANRPGVVRLYNELGLLEDAVAYDGVVLGYSIAPAFDPNNSQTNSISLVGTGAGADEFTWSTNTTLPTPGAANQGQSFDEAAVISVNSNSLTFNYIAQSLNPNSQVIIVSNSGGSALSYTINDNVAWLSVTVNSVIDLPPGSTQQHIVTADTTGLTGNRSASITIIGSAANSPVVISVNLNQTTLTDALVDYNLDEGAGTIAQNQGSLGTAANGTLINGGWTLEAQGASGMLGDYAYVSATNTARIQTGAAVTGINNLAKFTVSGWLRPSTATSGIRRILGNRTGTQGFELRTASDYQNLQIISSAGTSPAAVTSTNGSLPVAQWTFFAVTFDSTDGSSQAINFYNGSDSSSIYLSSSQSKGSLGASGVSTSSFYVGGNGTNAFAGWMDDMRVYAGVLDNMSIEAVRREGAIRFTGSGSAPVIEDQPESLSVSEGQSASFFVGASGIPFPSYQWRKFGVNLAGENTDNLYIDTVELADAGGYDVVVFNANGAVTSQVATLTVGGGMIFVIQPQSKTAYEGENVTFQALAMSTNPVTYQWRFNGGNIALQTNTTLVVNNVMNSNTGNYSVVAMDGISSLASTNAFLTVIPFVIDGPAGGISRPIGTNGVVIRWPSLSGRVYAVLWSSNLMNGTSSFIPIATGLNATPPLNAYTDTVYSVTGNGNYRISTVPP